MGPIAAIDLLPTINHYQFDLGLVTIVLLRTQPLRLFKSEQPWCQLLAWINGEGCNRKGIRCKT